MMHWDSLLDIYSKYAIDNQQWQCCCIRWVYFDLSQGNLKGAFVEAAILLHVWRWVIVPPDFFVAKPAKKFC